MTQFQVKPARAGSSIGVAVAYGVTDSLTKANAIISEVTLHPSPLFINYNGIYQFSFLAGN